MPVLRVKVVLPSESLKNFFFQDFSIITIEFLFEPLCAKEKENREFKPRGNFIKLSAPPK